MSDAGPRSGQQPAGPEHDAWLREALRHAPDASAAPPPSLRDAILAEARAAARTADAARTAASVSLLDRALALWSWLARPQVAAGFASVMAATLVGMLWWDRPMDETMVPPPSSPTVSAPRPAPEQGPAAGEKDASAANAERAAAPPADRTRELARSPSADSAPRDTAPAPAKTAPPQVAAEALAATEAARRQQAARATADQRMRAQADAKPVAKSEEATAERKDDKLKRARPPSAGMAPAAATTPTPSAARPAAEAPTPFPARSPAEAETATRQAAPAAASPLPATPSAQQPAPAQSRAEPFALEKKAESGERESAVAKARSAAPPAELRAPAAGTLGGAALDSSEASTAGRIAAQNAAESGPRQRIVPAVSSTRPMAPLLSALASEETRWSRRLASGGSVAVDAALRAWLAQVQAAAPRWQAVADRSARRDAPTAALSSPPTVLRLERDGAAGAIVQLEDGGVLFDPLSGSAWFAPLPPEVVARLRAALPAPR